MATGKRLKPVADVATADAAGAIYDAAEETLLNEVKAQLNALLAELREAGFLDR